MTLWWNEFLFLSCLYEKKKWNVQYSFWMLEYNNNKYDKYTILQEWRIWKRRKKWEQEVNETTNRKNRNKSGEENKNPEVFLSFSLYFKNTFWFGSQPRASLKGHSVIQLSFYTSTRRCPCKKLISKILGCILILHYQVMHNTGCPNKTLTPFESKFLLQSKYNNTCCLNIV